MRHVAVFLITLLFIIGCENSEKKFPIERPIGNEWVLRTDISKRAACTLEEHLIKMLDVYTETLPFPSKLKRQFKITIFSEPTEFKTYQEAISANKSENGFYNFHRGELVLLWRGVDDTLYTLYHEAFHAYFEERFIHPPQWLNEGLAEHMEYLSHSFLASLLTLRKKRGWEPELRSLRKDNAIPPISEILLNDWPKRHQLTKDQYALSWSIVDYFLNYKGGKEKDNFMQYLELLYNKHSPTSALHEVWPDISVLNEEWQDHIKDICSVIPFF